MLQNAVQVLDSPEKIQALSQPVRLEILDVLRQPSSAASVARAVGKSRQRVNYHLKELERLGLVRHAGEKRKGNFVEQLFQSVARRFVIASDFAWNKDELEATLRDQVSLAQLSSVGFRLQHDAAALIDRATFDGEQIASASLQVETSFADEAAREGFMQDLLESLSMLLKKHSCKDGAPFRLILAAYPEVEE